MLGSGSCRREANSGLTRFRPPPPTYLFILTSLILPDLIGLKARPDLFLFLFLFLFFSVDLCFFHQIKGKGSSPNSTILILHDAFSKYSKGILQAGQKASTTLQSYEKLLPLFMEGKTAEDGYKLCAADRGKEFLSVFKSTLANKYGTKIYNLHTGPHPKISVVERTIRSFKALCFQIFYNYNTLNVKDTLQLVNHVFNERPHKGIYGYSPNMAHKCPHTASIIARLNHLKYAEREYEAMTLYNKKPKDEHISPGDRVRVRVQRGVFRTANPLRASIWSKNIFVVTHKDLSQFPATFSLDNTSKKYYNFQLLKLSKYFPIDTASHFKPQILVNTYRLSEGHKLRSGKTSSSAPEAIYTILMNGKISEVDEAELKLYKRTLGEHSLAYSAHFNSPPNSSFVI